MDSGIVALLVLIAVKILFCIGVFYILKKLIDLVFDGPALAIRLHNQKKTSQHYFDHHDRYFDFQTGLWHWKPEHDPALKETSHA